MKVTDLKAIPLSIPMERPFVSINPRDRINPIVVQLFTDDGAEGLGLVFTWNDRQVASLHAIIDDLKEFVVGQDVLRHEESWQKLWKATRFMGHAGYVISAFSAIDMALWDLKAKALGVPVAHLLGGYRDKVPVYASHKLFRQWSLDELQEDANALVQQGFTAMKMNLGDKRPEEEVERVKVVRETVGDKVDLLVDVNWAWTPTRTVQMGRMLEPHAIYWLEDPLDSEDPDELAKVADALDVPIAVGETFSTKKGFRPLLEKGSGDILIVDIQRVGGVTEFMKVAAMAQAWNRPVASHIFHEFSLHMIAAIPNGMMVEYMPWWEMLYEEPPRVVDGWMTISDKPGWGLTLSRAALKKYRLVKS
jgi:L-alanine-DL-glutamate epimerase-like enolase superfamily enzyme